MKNKLFFLKSIFVLLLTATLFWGCTNPAGNGSSNNSNTSKEDSDTSDTKETRDPYTPELVFDSTKFKVTDSSEKTVYKNGDRVKESDVIYIFPLTDRGDVRVSVVVNEEIKTLKNELPYKIVTVTDTDVKNLKDGKINITEIITKKSPKAVITYEDTLKIKLRKASGTDDFSFAYADTTSIDVYAMDFIRIFSTEGKTVSRCKINGTELSVIGGVITYSSDEQSLVFMNGTEAIPATDGKFNITR